MKKLRLNTDDLVVEPFEIEAAEKVARGTVAGNDYSRDNCDTTVEASCGYPATCGGTSCDSGYPVCRQCADGGVD